MTEYQLLLHHYQYVVLLAFDHAAAYVELFLVAVGHYETHGACFESRDDGCVVLHDFKQAVGAGQLQQLGVALIEGAVGFYDSYVHFCIA